MKTLDQTVDDHALRIRRLEDLAIEVRGQVKGIVTTFRVFGFIVTVAIGIFTLHSILVP